MECPHPTGSRRVCEGAPASVSRAPRPAWPGHHRKGCLGLTASGFSSHTAGASRPHSCLTCPSAGGLAWRSSNLSASHHQRGSWMDQLKEAALSRQARNAPESHPGTICHERQLGWAELGGTMAEDRPGAHWASDCCGGPHSWWAWLCMVTLTLTEPPMV